MCGIHTSDGRPVGHVHNHPPRTMLARPQPFPRGRSRRRFLGEFGKGSLAMAVMTPAVIAACSSDGGSETGSATSTPSNSSSTTAEPTTTTTTAPVDDTSDAPADTVETQPLRWARAELGFVSAFVLARGTSAAIVDTGVAGSADAIGQSLTDLSLTYNDVEHVVLTHHHGDHARSIAEVMERSSNATVYAGEADLDEISFGTITGLIGGEDIFGLEALATPGHTAGHMAVIDHDTGLLVAGDAIFTAAGAAVEGPDQFFDDIPLNRESIRKMAQLSYNTLLVGHGDPIESGADAVVAELAASF